MTTTPEQPAEGRLIQAARERLTPPRSMNKLGELVGISGTRWSQIERGYSTRSGTYLKENAPTERLARMAHAVDVTPQQLREAGRDDAADWLERMLGETDDSPPLQADVIHEGGTVILRIEMPGVPQHLRDTALRLAKEAAERAAHAVAEVAETTQG